MVKKVTEYHYEISTAGLVGKMHFSPSHFCGKIKYGIGLNVEPLRGGWVIPLGEAWQMVIISTIDAFVQIIKKTLRFSWKKRIRHDRP